MGSSACEVWASVCACMSAFLCVITSVGLAARFMVELVGVDNSIREETDLEAEWRRRREMTAWSSSDQYCLVMTPWCVHQGHTKQTRPPFIGLHHLHLWSVVSRLTGSLYGLHWGIGCYLLIKVYVIGSFSCPFHCLCLCLRQCFRTEMNFGLHRGMLVCRQLLLQQQMEMQPFLRLLAFDELSVIQMDLGNNDVACWLTVPKNQQ